MWVTEFLIRSQWVLNKCVYTNQKIIENEKKIHDLGTVAYTCNGGTHRPVAGRTDLIYAVMSKSH